MYQNIFIDREKTGSTVFLWDDEKGLLEFDYKPFDYAYRITNTPSKIQSMYGHNLQRITRWHDGDPTVFEGDVPMETRVLTDLYLEMDSPSKLHRLMFFDIEVSMDKGIPDIQKAKNEITSITTWVDGKYIIFLVSKLENLILETKQPATLRIFKTEKELLGAFLDYYQQIAPTIISHWNGDYFDVPYLYHRLQNVFNRETANKLSPIGKLRFSPKREKWFIAGVSSLDYLSLYRKFTYSQRENYRLDTIGELELGLRKISYTGTLDDLYKNDITRFAEYNLRDVEILVKLDEKLKLIELVRGICHTGHVPYEDFSYSSRFIEGTILCFLHRKGLVAPNKDPNGHKLLEDAENNQIIGAYVKDPVPGRYEWVYSLDVQSLYPSLMMTLNISPETKVGKVANWNIEQHIKNQITKYDLEDLSKKTSVLSKQEFEEFMAEGKFTISANGVIYRTDIKGVIPSILEEWFARRLEYKKLMKEAKTEEEKDYYDRLQHIQKIFLNSCYGYVALPVSRFYDRDNGEATTVSGQEITKATEKFVNTNRNENCVVYSDTDSIYALSKHNKMEDIVKEAQEMERKINAFYDVVCSKFFYAQKHRIQIKGEAVADAGFWITKKRYALHKVFDLGSNKPTDSITIKGLDIVRSSFPNEFKRFMKDCLNRILKGSPQPEIDDKLQELYTAIASYPVEQIARNTGVSNISEYFTNTWVMGEYKSKTPAHIKASINYNRLLKHFKLNNKHTFIRDGDKIKWVVLKTNPYELKEIAFKGKEDPKQIMEFIEKYTDFQEIFNAELLNKVEAFYSALKWKLPPLSVKQTDAANFFDF